LITAPYVKLERGNLSITLRTVNWDHRAENRQG
jgi:hypothetical protein